MAESEVKSAALGLGKLLVEQISNLDGVRDQVQELQTELNTLAAFLIEAVKTRRQDQVVQTVLAEARNVAYDCEDVIEKYILEVARHGYEEYEGCQLGSAVRWACLAVNAVPILKIHSKIAKLNKRISALKTRMRSYGVHERISTAAHLSEPLRRVYSHEREECEVVGFESQLDELVERLLNPSKETVIAICGMGGIGKSTLARKLYHHPKLRDGGYFGAFGWAAASRQLQPDRVLQTLMYSLVPENDHERRRKIDDDIKADRAHAALYNLMKCEKCLVVIDDIWTSNDWDKLQAAFPRKKASGSRILLTTRNEETKSRLDPTQMYLHPVKALDETNSWKLFEMTAFSGATCTDVEKEELGREMLQHCKGVPLAIVVLGEVLKRKDRVEDWKQMWKNDVAQIRRGGVPNVLYKEVYDVLQISYDELPFHLKHCFLHLANFPEIYEIPAGKLLQLWVGEGIVLNEDPNEREENVASIYLNDLVDRNMVQVASRAGGTGRIACVRLHDLMRDICIDIAKREGFLQTINCQRSMLTNHKDANHLLMTWLPKRDKRLRRLAVYESDQEPQSSTLSATAIHASAKVSRAPNLRSLFLFSVNNKRGEGNCQKIVETISDHFPLLRVFHCEDFQIQGKLPKQVENMVHLRYLCLANTLVTELPSSIHKLQCLQTLDLRVDSEVLCLPNVLWKMKQLRHLYLPYYKGLRIAEKQRVANGPQTTQRYVIKEGGMLRLDGLCNLQTLNFIDLDKVDKQGLSKLEKMDTLCATCETNKEALYPFLQCSSLTSFLLRIHARIINEDPMILSSCEVMHHLDIHAGPCDNFSLLKPLCLEMLPKSLVRLDIWYLELADDPLPVLERLPNLAYLGLHMCFRGSYMVCSTGGFPVLIQLCFDELLEFCDWEVEVGALQKLKTLLMINCGVKKIPNTLPSSVNASPPPMKATTLPSPINHQDNHHNRPACSSSGNPTTAEGNCSTATNKPPNQHNHRKHQKRRSAIAKHPGSTSRSPTHRKNKTLIYLLIWVN